MDKVLVCILVPAIDKKYDVSIPKYLEIKTVIRLLAKALAGITNNGFFTSGMELLCWKEKEIVLNEKKTFSEYGIQNGDILYFY